MQIWIDRMIETAREKRMQDSPQITLGEMIRRLEAIPPTYESGGAQHPKRVWFDFGRTYPVELQSWRGSYAELALTFDYDGRISRRYSEPWASPEYPTAEQVLAMLRNAVGNTFTGYKGGDFTMDESTPIWVANYGDSGNTGVVGVRDLKWEIVIDTAWCEF